MGQYQIIYHWFNENLIKRGCEGKTRKLFEVIWKQKFPDLMKILDIFKKIKKNRKTILVRCIIIKLLRNDDKEKHNKK